MERKTVSKKKLETIELGLSLCLDRKLDKLNLLLKQMNVYLINRNLIVNDRYNVIQNFIETVMAFGMDIKEMEVKGFKGKTYVLGDVITKLLSVIGKEYSFSSKIKINELPADIKIGNNQLFAYNELNKIYDDELINYLRQINNKGELIIKGNETFIDGISQGIVSNQEMVESKLKKYFENIKKEACENNKKVQYGTTQILYERARQMGYYVEKTINGKEVQLVLVRIN